MEPNYLAKHRKFFHTTELMLPTEPDVRFSDTQMAIYLLSCLHSINICAIAGTLDRPAGGREELGLRKSSTVALLASGSDGKCSVVNRFENYGGGWGYSAHCVEAIQFKTNCDITFCGVGIFGGRGEYVGKLKLFRVIGGADLEGQCVELLGETDEVIYECTPRETAFLQLAKTILVRANQWHVIWAQIQGPSSDCGAGGQVTIRSENVEFQFCSSLLSNNGTDVDVGRYRKSTIE
uniref:PHR domain-containing protein n=1 Tax=Ditylenchus dipsaci TaxID=166011 RepID=A0A915CQK0_9BILA